MDMLETALKNKKEELDGMKAPEELEVCLRHALQDKKRRMYYKPVAAVLAAVLILSYSFDAIAYYGKKFIGYEQMTVGSLKELNEEGRGQEINRSCTFSNGVVVTVDGIMFDENELVAFYKVSSSTGKLQDLMDRGLPTLRLNGIKPMGYFSRGGQGLIVDDRNMTFVDTLEPPEFYEKWMSLDVELKVDKKMEVQKIDFTLDRNKAMNRIAKKDLNVEAKLGDYRIIFERLTASTMSSVLDGRILPLKESGLEAFKAETVMDSIRIPHLRFDIVSDNGEVSQFNGSQSASDEAITFSSTSDALPKDFKTLQIRNIRFETMAMVDKTVDVGPDTRELKVADDMAVKQVYKEGADVCVVISSRGIPVLGLFAGDKQLEQVNPDAYDREAESAAPVDRVYRFKDTGGDLKLSVKLIKYLTYSKDTIDIPVN